MIVVNGVQVVVLIVPAEGAELHAHVQPRYVHSVDRRLLALIVHIKILSLFSNLSYLMAESM